MSLNTLPLDATAIHESFCQWQAEQESLDAEWNESLAALAAYQSHLDTWQADLICQRDKLERERDEWARQRAMADHDQEHTAAQAASQLAELRERNSLITQQLLTRTEELRDIDQQRSALVAEVELARTQAATLAASVDEKQRALELERAAWTEQLLQMRELVEQRSDEAPAAESGDDAVASAPVELMAVTAPPLTHPTGAHVAAVKPSASPVLSSIVEQFGKLRQQRAFDRQASKKPR